MKRSFLALWGRRLRYGVYALLALVGLLALAWVVFYEFFFRPAIFRAMLEEMTDVRLERIALEEARRRAPFPICLPTWLPEGLEEPEIAFHSEWGAPWVADVTLTYRQQGQSVLEIFQGSRPWRWKTRSDPHQDLTYVVFRLLEWQTGFDKAEYLKKEAYGVFQQYIERGDRQYRIFELVSPPEYRAYWVDWWSAQPLSSPPGEQSKYGVYYRISSRFSLSETLRVGDELKECLPPLLTPIPGNR